MKYTVTHIKYDTEDTSDLPEQLIIDVPDDIIEDVERVVYISDKISDITGFCHKGFATDPILNE